MQESNLNFERSLEYQFLYNDDPDSIFLLLSWLENKNVADSLIPKYIVTKALLTGLRRSIRKRADKKSIVDAISKLVSDDLNRLELAFIIKAYRNSLNNYDIVNKLENLALKKYNPDELSNMKSLFHDSNDQEVLKLKNKVQERLLRDKVLAQNEYHINMFLDKHIKSKFFRVNFYMDKQVVVDYTNADILRLEGKNLTINELLHIYAKAKFYINRSMTEAYLNQFWYSLNDLVLCRYKW